VRNTRKFVERFRAKTARKLLAQMDVEILMLVPEAADGFRATTGALRSLGEGKGVSFHKFFLPEKCCIRLLLKNLGKCVSEAEIKEEQGALHINVQGLMQRRSKIRDQDPEKDRPLTRHEALSWLKCCLSPKYAACELSLEGDLHSHKSATAVQTLPALRAHAV
jgi:hypothetical protein